MIKIKRGLLVSDLKIEDLAFGGKGIARVETEQGGFTLFVPNTLPGQVVQARITKKRKRYAECKLIRVQTPAPDELEQPYQPIPGAPFARFPVELQERYKRDTTLEMFKRIGETPEIESLYEGMISSPKSWHYRNKMEYSFSTLESEVGTGEESEGFALGFKRRGQWWAVENLDKDSGLFDEVFENNLWQIRAFCESSGLPAWNPGKHEGFFRFLAVRKSYAADELLFNLVTHSEGLDKFDMEGFIALLQKILGARFAGLIHTINDQTGDRVPHQAGAAKLIYGKEKIAEEILGLSFEISMQSFFQTNPGCAEKLYSKAMDYVREGLPETAGVAMDLFCGTGTIAQLLAADPRIPKVIGVDIVEEAIEDAKRNAARNGVDNIEFYAADVGKFLLEYPHFTGKIHTIVLDPPRAGIAPKTLRKVIRLGAQRMVYISCNPSTQARDTLALREAGYKLTRYCLADQFPHTSHVESIAVFERAE